MRKVVGVVAFVVVGALVLGGLAWWAARPSVPGEFYERATDVPSASGVVVRAEPFRRGVPEGARGWRILSTSTGMGGGQTVVSGTVLVPERPPEGGYGPIVAWAHGTTGIVRGCAPSMMPKPWAGIPALDEVIERGWVVVATDYEGLGTTGRHPYLVGEVAARNVLDSIAAVRSLAEREPEAFGDGGAPEGPAVVWGHSQGGHSTIFSVQDAGAAEAGVVGGAAIAPATDLAALLEAADGTPVGKALTSLAMVAWSDVYDDVELDEVVRPLIVPLVRDIASRCITIPEALVSVLEASAIWGDVLAVDPTEDPVLSAHLAANSPTGASAAGDPVDLFVAQGQRDDVVDPDVTERWVRRACRQDATVVELHTYADQDHLSIVADGSPVDEALLAWTEDRLAGGAPPAACTTTEH
ncbi:MAG: alpha/beta fold hydrolase [Acidimicrobiales bacterium]